MQRSTIIWLATLGLILLGLCYAMYYTRTVVPPQSGNCDAMRALNPTAKWAKDCKYIMETSPDSSLQTPKSPLYLSNFTVSSSMGQGLGANVWYRYKYVRGNGSYGSFSPWTKAPIIAGAEAKDLPCKDSSCSGIKTGSESCRSNLVRLKVDSLEYSMTDADGAIFANIYRLVKSSSDNTPPVESDSGEIIGMIIPQSAGGMFIDTDSPCKKINCSRPNC